MSRKKPNLFGSVMRDMAEEDRAEALAREEAHTRPALTGLAAAAAQARPASVPPAFRSGPVAALSNDLRSSRANTIRDIDPALIDASRFADRLEISDESVQELAQSIEKFGQRVPVLVRPSPDHPDRFVIVYGRRRLAALKLIGQPIRAMVREMTEEDAVLAQGQENGERLDPSFIEKALFMNSLAEAGYSTEVAMDALAVNKSAISHMRRVLNHVPEADIRMIGPAHGIGRRRWHEAVDLIIKFEIDPSVDPAIFEDIVAETDRFTQWFNHLAKIARGGKAKQQVIEIKEKSSKKAVFARDNGKKIGEVRTSGRHVQLAADPKQKEFSQWLAANGEEVLARLYAEWGKVDGA